MTKTALDRANAKASKASGTAMKRQSIAPIPRTQTVTIPKPVFKFSGSPGGKAAATTTTPSVVAVKTEPISRPSPQLPTMNIKMEVDEDYMSSAVETMKRKREEDDFEAVE